MIDNKQEVIENKQKKKKGWVPMTLTLLVVCALVLLAGLSLYFAFPENIRNAFIAIYASVAGSFCALLGVVMSLSKNKELNDENKKDDYKPAFFVPCRCDISKSEKIPLFINGNKVPSVTKYNRYFQNSEKIGFRLQSVEYGGKTFEAKGFYVEKGKQFSLNFEKAYGNHTVLIMKIESLCNVPYKVTINTKLRIVDVQYEGNEQC